MGGRGKTALITGALNGIGYEFSRLYAAAGYNLVLVARRAEKLDDIAADFRKTYQVDVMPLAKDLPPICRGRDLVDALRPVDHG